MDFEELHRSCSKAVPDCEMYLHEVGCQMIAEAAAQAVLMQSLFYRDKCKDFGEITCKVAGF